MMPQYFFHTQNGALVLDDVGTDLANLRIAKIEATRLLGALIGDAPEDFLSTNTIKLMVTDGGGALLFALELSGVEPPSISLRLVRDFL